MPKPAEPISRVILAALCLSSALAAAESGAGEKTKTPSRPRLATATLELAPGDLGNVRTGKDATTAGADGGKIESTFFTYQVAIEDIAWDSLSHQLVMLLARGIANDVGALDLLDPTTGQVERLLLEFPADVPHVELTQLAVGSRYLWLRGHPGDGPTFRLDREALAQAQAIKAPRVERASSHGER